MKLLNYVLAAGLVLAIPAHADELASLAEKGEANVEQAMADLNTLRTKIASEKVPLSKELTALQQEVIRMRKDAERARAASDNMGVSLESLKTEVKARDDDVDYLSNLLAEYARSLKVRMNVAEFQLYEEPIDKSLDILTRSDVDDGTVLDSLSSSVDIGLKRAVEIIGGSSYKGKAITESGDYVSGNFVLLGPLAYFATDAGTGGLIGNGKSDQPSVSFIDSDAGTEIKAVAAAKSGTLPIDSTLGNALAIAATKDSLVEHTKKGGIWIYPILGFALAAFLMAIIKAVDIFSLKVTTVDSVNKTVDLLRNGDTAGALHYANALEGPGGEMLKQGVQSVGQERETLEEILSESVLNLQPRLERMLPFISLTAAISPLLGLLGTVTGMINTFNLITVFGTGDAKSLSGGISEALITTEYGLVVAIPALVLHAILSRKVQGILASLESQAIAFVNSTSFMRK